MLPTFRGIANTEWVENWEEINIGKLDNPESVVSLYPVNLNYLFDDIFSDLDIPKQSDMVVSFK